MDHSRCHVREQKRKQPHVKRKPEIEKREKKNTRAQRKKGDINEAHNLVCVRRDEPVLDLCESVLQAAGRCVLFNDNVEKLLNAATRV